MPPVDGASLLAEEFPDRDVPGRIGMVGVLRDAAKRSSTHVGDSARNNGELAVEIVNVVAAIEWAADHAPGRALW